MTRITTMGSVSGCVPRVARDGIGGLVNWSNKEKVMTGKSGIYAYGFDLMRAASCSWPFSDIQVALVNKEYAPDVVRDRYWCDIKKYEIKGRGYTAGGQPLQHLGHRRYGDTTELTSAPPEWGPKATITYDLIILFGQTGNPDTAPLLSFHATPWWEHSVCKGTLTIAPYAWITLAGLPLPAR
jgi:hypothetical protein